MVYCLKPGCQQPVNPDGTNFCRSCGTKVMSLLRGRYRIIKPLGNGGFGRTFLAEDEDKLRELCVVKQLAPEVQGIQALQKATELFQEEARRLQQLGEHPQIPNLYAYFEQDYYLYLVQQYITGQTLEQELEQQGVFHEAKIRELLTELLPVLQFVHEHQVIHRDIKPENIIRRPILPNRGEAKESLVLIDFGVAKQLTTTVTKRGTTIGSFGYAPLEQMKGGEAYPASDLYSLGVTCFYLLTGVDPLELWTDRGYGWVSSWQQYLQGWMSRELQLILDRLLHKDFQERYQSAAEVLSDLHGKPKRHQRQLKASNPRKFLLPFKSVLPRQNTWLVAGVILLLGLGGYGSWQLQKRLSAKTTPWEQLVLARTFTAHSDLIGSVAISPDGKTLVSGSNDNTIKIWNLSTGQLKNILMGHTSWVGSVAISPDGKILTSGGGDNTIRIWNLSTGQLLHTLTGHSKWVNSLAISPRGDVLVSGSGDNTIKIWQLGTGQLRGTLTRHSYGVLSVSISPNGQTLVSGNGRIWPFGDDDYNIKVWRLAPIPKGETKDEKLSFPLPIRTVDPVAVSSNRQSSVSGSTGIIGIPKRTLVGHLSNVDALAISSDGQTLVSGSSDTTIKIWQLSTGTLRNTLTGHADSVVSLAISSDGQTLVSGSSDKTLKIWQLSTGTLQTTLTGHSGSVTSVAISPDSKTVVSGSSDRTLKIWRLPSEVSRRRKLQ